LGSITDPRVAELERVIAELRTRLKDTEANLVLPDMSGTDTLILPAPLRPVGQPTKHFARQEATKQSLPAPLPAPLPVAFDVPADMTPPLVGLLARARELWSALPTTCPAAFQKICPAAAEPENI